MLEKNELSFCYSPPWFDKFYGKNLTIKMSLYNSSKLFKFMKNF